MISFAEELQRYLERGIDLQHRRLERTRLLASTGEPYQQQYEERVKWRQEVATRVAESRPVTPATWDILPTYL
jgi:hypothetical protein